MGAKAELARKGPFLTDSEEIRRRAREHIRKGSVTALMLAAFTGDQRRIQCIKSTKMFGPKSH